MNLSQTIDLQAGGPGSGCKGPNCGRPEGHKGPHGPAGKELPETVKNPIGTVGSIRPGDVNPRSAGRKRYDKFTQRQTSGTVDMQRWKQLQPTQQKQHNPQGIEEGDKIRTTAPVIVHENGVLKTYPVGRQGLVQGLGYGQLPNTVGSTTSGLVPVALVKLSKNSDPERVPLKDVFLTEKGEINRPDIPVADVRRGRIVSQSTTPDGAKYTVIKPSDAPDEETRGKFKPHADKGTFKEVTGQVKVLAQPMVRAQVFSSERREDWEKMPDNTYRRMGTPGTTVFVYRHYDTKETVIQEFRTGQYGHAYMMAKEYTYKNMGAASKFLNAKYGIRQSLPRKLK